MSQDIIAACAALAVTWHIYRILRSCLSSYVRNKLNDRLRDAGYWDIEELEERIETLERREGITK